MSELVERQFPAKALVTGLRAIGYSFSTAVADIIDNSVSAEATEIKIFSDPLATEPNFCILDNGYGMSRKELDNAMLPGSDREDKVDSKIELGRFGLGLKSASLSQCREFIVASKKYGKLQAMAFDLDQIEASNKLLLKQLNDEEISRLPNIDELKKYQSGTLVIWTKFDKIDASAENFEDSFRDAVANSKKHVELVFHRFYDEINIYYNNRRIEKRDPFLLGSVGRQQTGRTQDININGSKVTVTPYTLPFANTLTSEEKKLLGEPKSIFDEQGFYLYRNRRLILWGTWMRMGIRSELNKLARIKVDFPSSLDSVWMLDVKKSSAKIPDKIKDQIKMAVQDSIVRSKRANRYPGTKEQSHEATVWDRIDEREGRIKYQINRDNPVYVALSENIGEKERELLELLISQIECFLPKGTIINDTNDSLRILNSGDDIEEEEMIRQIKAIIAMTDVDKQEKMFYNIFKMEGYQQLEKRKDEIHRSVFGE